MSDLQLLMKECHDISVSKGFDPSDHMSQLLLIASEIDEALENGHIQKSAEGTDYEYERFMQDVVGDFSNSMCRLNDFRVTVGNPATFIIEDKEKYMEEIADIFIRLFTYAYGFGADEMTDVILKKMHKNRNRPHKHGKKF